MTSSNIDIGLVHEGARWLVQFRSATSDLAIWQAYSDVPMRLSKNLNYFKSRMHYLKPAGQPASKLFQTGPLIYSTNIFSHFQRGLSQ